MATLTYNNEEAQPGELNADEQDSLQVGELLQQEEQQMFAGKFQDAEQLEKAYLELQAKLGESRGDEPQQEQVQEEEEVTQSILEELWDKATANEEISQEFLNELQQQDPTELAKMYLEYRQSVQEQGPQQMDPETVTGLQGIVGGEQQYGQMMQWAGSNLSEQDINLYDQVMERGDPAACYFAVQALQARYQDSVGVDSNVITGTAPRGAQKGYRSQQELVQAMSDPRYDTDPAYRMDVVAKLEQSNDLMF